MNDVSIAWAQIGVYGQVTGRPYTGTVDGLMEFASRGVSDMAKFSRDDNFSYYDLESGRSMICTLVKVSLPWGDYRYIPNAATRPAPRRRRLTKLRRSLRF